jgi:hypothetical protein
MRDQRRGPRRLAGRPAKAAVDRVRRAATVSDTGGHARRITGTVLPLTVENRREAPLKLGLWNIPTHSRLAPDRHTERAQPVDLGVENATGQHRSRNTRSEHSTGVGLCLEDGHKIAATGELIRAGEPGGTRTDHRDSFDVALRSNPAER